MAIAHDVAEALAGGLGRGVGGHRSRPGAVSALAEAIQRLVEELRAAPELERERWRRRLEKALGHNARAITELCPDLEQLLGATSPLPRTG